MRPVFAREIAELAPLIGALIVVAWITGLESVSPGSDYDGMLAMVIVGGAAVGLIQGGLDRWRRSDLFFRHRPVGALRFELARTFAGMIAVIAPSLVLIVVHRYATAATLADRRTLAWWQPWGPIRQLTPEETLLLGAAFVCAWTSVRYGLSRPRVWIALLLCGVLPVVCWAIGSRFGTHAGAATLALGASTLLGALNVLDLAGERR